MSRSQWLIATAALGAALSACSDVPTEPSPTIALSTPSEAGQLTSTPGAETETEPAQTEISITETPAGTAPNTSSPGTTPWLGTVSPVMPTPGLPTPTAPIGTPTGPSSTGTEPLSTATALTTTGTLLPSTPTAPPLTETANGATPTVGRETPTANSATATEAVSTSSAVPWTPTEAPTVILATPTENPVTATAVPQTPTVHSATPTVVQATLTAIPATPTLLPETPTPVPATATAIPPTATVAPATATAVPATATAIPATPTAILATLTAILQTPTASPDTPTVEPTPSDGDDDGYPMSEDCNDGDPDINPAAEEVCDGLDNDCDSSIDEGVENTWYQDADGDGYGNVELSLQACDVVVGYVDNDLDCDDSNPDIGPGTVDCPITTQANTCLEILDGGIYDTSGHYDLQAADDSVYTVYCDMHTDGGGWTLIADLYAGTNEWTSIYKDERFFNRAWVQEQNSYIVSDNSGVILGDGNFGMLDSRDLFNASAEIRYSCDDTTRELSADLIWEPTVGELDALLNSLTYSSTSVPVAFSYDGAEYEDADVYPISTEHMTNGSWHICGGGVHDREEVFTIGACSNGPTTADSGVSGVPQIAIGYHHNYDGLRLECTADTPSDTHIIEGTWSAWVR